MKTRRRSEPTGRTRQTGPTGRTETQPLDQFVLCPGSRRLHGPAFAQIQKRNSLFAECPIAACSWKAFFRESRWGNAGFTRAEVDVHVPSGLVFAARGTTTRATQPPVPPRVFCVMNEVLSPRGDVPKDHEAELGPTGRFIPCVGASVPQQFHGANPNAVFLEIIRGRRCLFSRCKLCGYTGFLRGSGWPGVGDLERDIRKAYGGAALLF